MIEVGNDFISLPLKKIIMYYKPVSELKRMKQGELIKYVKKMEDYTNKISWHYLKVDEICPENCKDSRQLGFYQGYRQAMEVLDVVNYSKNEELEIRVKHQKEKTLRIFKK